MAKTPPLEIEINLTPSGFLSNVALDGRDISNYVRGIYIEAGVGELTEVSIDYGNVNVSGKIRTEKLHEATTPVDITGLGDENRRYGLVQPLPQPSDADKIVNATKALHENKPAHEQVTNARKALGCE